MFLFSVFVSSAFTVTRRRQRRRQGLHCWDCLPSETPTTACLSCLTPRGSPRGLWRAGTEPYTSGIASRDGPSNDRPGKGGTLSGRTRPWLCGSLTSRKRTSSLAAGPLSMSSVTNVTCISSGVVITSVVTHFFDFFDFFFFFCLPFSCLIRILVFIFVPHFFWCSS